MFPRISLLAIVKPMKVFTEEEEKLLEDYLKKAAALYYGLNPTEVRILAYEFAVKNNKLHLFPEIGKWMKKPVLIGFLDS